MHLKISSAETRPFCPGGWVNTSNWRLTHLPRMPHICVSESGQHWFRWWLVAYSAPSHYLNQCWVVVNGDLRNKLQWIFIQNTKLFIHENSSENVVCGNATILSRGWINTSNWRLMNGSWLSHCKQQLLLFSTASSFSESWWHHHMKHFPHYWPFVRGIHRSPVNSPQKGQWRGPLMFTLICVWINDWVNNREAGDLRRYRAYYDVTLMYRPFTWESFTQKQIFGCL